MSPARRRDTDKDDRRPVTARLELANLGDGEPPELHVDLIDAQGGRAPAELSREGELQLDPRLVGEGYRLEIRGAAGEGRRYDYDSFVARARKNAVYVLPEAAWRKLVFWNTCVTGSVRACWPRYKLYDLVALAAKPDGLELARRYLPHPELELSRFLCAPVCKGKVEVFLRTCCCPPPDPPSIIRDICEIIDCYELEWPRKPWEPPGPWPEPDPWRDPRFQRTVQQALQRSEAVEGGRQPEDVVRLAFHYQALRAAGPSEQRAYIELYPELRYLFCACSTVKVAETYLEEDGHFDACFYASPFLPRGCSRRVQYRVSQLHESGWVVVYDGAAKGQSFPLDTEAQLTASSQAYACEEPHDWGPVPFVILDRIGGTWADNLIHSTQQGGEDAAGLPTFAGPLAATDGLVNPAPAGPPPAVMAGPYEQPWATTLAVHYAFHPGLAALGAKYYRTRVVRVGSNGQPVTGPGAVNQTVTGDLSWRKFYNPPGPEDVGVMWVPLNNPVVNGVEGLYTIPFPDLVYPWLDGQFHAAVDTSGVPNGRYLFVVDIFNAAGQRLVPTNSVEPPAAGEVGADFRYRRLDGPIDAQFSSTSIVPRRALASLFLVDNLPTYADIEAIVHNAVSSDANCQFLVGPGTDTARLRYSAYQASGYQWYHRISFKQGLTGPVTNLPPSNANVFSGLSQALTFDDLLPGPDKKCAFASTLHVHTKHTNGSGRVQDFDRSDIAAFAVQISP